MLRCVGLLYEVPRARKAVGGRFGHPPLDTVLAPLIARLGLENGPFLSYGERGFGAANTEEIGRFDVRRPSLRAVPP